METIVVDCGNDEQVRVTVSEQEQAALAAMRADFLAREAAPSRAALLAMMLEDVTPTDDGTAALLLVVQEVLRS